MPARTPKRRFLTVPMMPEDMDKIKAVHAAECEQAKYPPSLAQWARIALLNFANTHPSGRGKPIRPRR